MSWKCVKGLAILRHERREQVNSIIMEHFKNIIFHNFEPVNKQHVYQSSITKVQNNYLLQISRRCLWISQNRIKTVGEKEGGIQ